MKDKITQKQIKEEISLLTKKLNDIRDYYKNIPELSTLEIQIRKLKDDYADKISSTVDHIRSDIRQLENNLRELKENKKIKFSPDIEEWFDKYDRGIHFGYKGIKISWISEDERFVIITSGGGTAGQGTAMGTGGYYYAPSQHWIADTRKGGYSSGNKFCEIEGRLTKEAKQKMFDYIDQNLRNK